MVWKLRTPPSYSSLSLHDTCVYEKSGPLPSLSISWFKASVVVSRFYASVRNTATPLYHNVHFLTTSMRQLHHIHLPIKKSDLVSSSPQANVLRPPHHKSLILITKQSFASFGPHKPSCCLPLRSCTSKNKISLVCFLIPS